MPPRRRKTTAKKDSACRGLTAEEEEQNQNIQLLIQDIDKSLGTVMTDTEVKAEALCKSLKSMYSIAFMKLPPGIRDLTMEQYLDKCSNEGSLPFAPLSAAMDAIFVEEVNQQVSCVKSAVEASSSKSRRGARSTAKKPPRTATRAKQNKSQELATSEPRAPLVAITPAQSRQQLPPNFGGATPAITPKFNTRTPMSRTVSRTARPNEVLMSLSGSPVIPLNLRTKVAKAEAENKVPIPLGAGNILHVPMLPDDESGGALEDLDEEQLEKIRLFHKNLTSLLQMRSEPMSD